MSLTIGVAFATVLVVGGILATPSIIDCSHQGGGIGACLREKVQHSGLRPAEISAPSSSLLSSEAPPPPPIAAPVTITPIPVVSAHDDGWIDARANEYEPAPPPHPVVDGALGGMPQVTASANLAPAPAIAPPVANGEIGRQPQPNASVALVAAASEAAQPDATGDIGRQTEANGSAALVAAASQPVPALPVATGDIGPKPSPAATAALVAEASEPASGDIAAPSLAQSLSQAPLPLVGLRAGRRQNHASGVILGEKAMRAAPEWRGWGWGATPSGTSVGATSPVLASVTADKASVAAPTAPPHPPTIAQRPKADVKPRPVATPKGPPRHLPVRKPPRHIFKNDPRFPNVTVLPPPATGSGSSFVTLQTH
ncbi:MAG TPA: hypothetical protein VGM83_14090 [Devosiaceae bacterium]